MEERKPKKTMIRTFLGRMHRSKSRGNDCPRNKAGTDSKDQGEAGNGTTMSNSKSDGTLKKHSDLSCSTSFQQKESRDLNDERPKMSPARRLFSRLSTRKHRSSTADSCESLNFGKNNRNDNRCPVKTTSEHDLHNASVNSPSNHHNQLQNQLKSCGGGAVSEMDLRFVTTRSSHMAVTSDEPFGFGVKSPRGYLSETDLASGAIDSPEVVRTPSYLRVSCALNGYHRSSRNDGESPISRMGESLVQRRLKMFTQPQDRSQQNKDEFGSPFISAKTTESKSSEMETSTPIQKSGGIGTANRIHALQQSEMGNSISTPGPIKDLISKFDQLDLCSSSKNQNENVENIEPHKLVINQQPDFDDQIPEIGLKNEKNDKIIEDKDPNGNDPEHENEKDEKKEEPLKIALDAESDSGISGSGNFSPESSKRAEKSDPQTGEEFRKLHDRVKEELQKKMEEAMKDLENEEVLPEKCAESLRAANGNAHLLVRKKFGKFLELIDKHLNPIDGDPMPVNFPDLEAFWTTIDMELDGIQKEFAKVETYRAANWDENAVVEVEEPKVTPSVTKPVVPLKKKAPVAMSAEAKEKLDKQRAAAEQRRAELRTQMRQKMKEIKKNEDNHDENSSEC